MTGDAAAVEAIVDTAVATLVGAAPVTTSTTTSTTSTTMMLVDCATAAQPACNGTCAPGAACVYDVVVAVTCPHTTSSAVILSPWGDDAINDSTMAQLLVRNLDAILVRRLRARAATRGHSAEAEHREILRRALGRGEAGNLGEGILAMPAGGTDADFAPPRGKARRVRL